MSMVADYTLDENEGAPAVSGRWGFRALLKGAFTLVRAAEPAPVEAKSPLSAPVDYELPRAKEEKVVAKPLPYTPEELIAAKIAIAEEKMQTWGDVPFIGFADAVRDLPNPTPQWKPTERTIDLIPQISRNLRI